MEYMELVLYDNYYDLKCWSSEWIQGLGFFLLYDVGSTGAETFSDWVLDPTYNKTESNYCSLTKEGNFIVIRDIEFVPGETGIPVSIERLALLKILSEWGGLCQKRVKAITIFYDNQNWEVKDQKLPEDLKAKAFTSIGPASTDL